MIFDFLITLGIVVLSIAVVMEGVKEGIEWIGNKIASKKAKENILSGWSSISEEYFYLCRGGYWSISCLVK